MANHSFGGPARPENEELARSVGASFLRKGSPLLLEELRRVMLEDFGFGDFVFRRADGSEIARAWDLHSLEETLRRVPAESVHYHGSRNHFSRWLKARTNFSVAHALRPRRPEDFPDLEAMREHLAAAIAEYREEQAKREAGRVVEEAHAEARAVLREAAAERERLERESRRIRSLLRSALDTVEVADADGDDEDEVEVVPGSERWEAA